MRPLIGVSVLLLLVLTGCAGAGPTGAPTLPGQTPGSAPTDTRRPTPTPRAVESAVPVPSTVAATCPSGPLVVLAFLGADPGCYATEDVAVVGWWGARRTDDPGRGVVFDHVLRGSMPFGSQSQAPEDVIYVDEQAVVPIGGWPGGVHWATITGRRSAPSDDRSCHYDEVDLVPARHCPSYLIATRIVESEPPASALASCTAMPRDEGGLTSVEAFTAYPPACWGSRDVTVDGWLDIRYLISGWEDPWGIAPAWLWVPIGPWTVVAPGSNPETSEALVVYADPARHVDLGRTNRWVALTGHYGDPAAQTCRVVYSGGYDAARDGPRITDAFARRSCEAQFVATSVRDTSP